MNKTDLIFLLIAAVVGLINWLRSKSSANEETELPGPNPFSPRSRPKESEEEKVRRFTEALGVPVPPAPSRAQTPSKPAAKFAKPFTVQNKPMKTAVAPQTQLPPEALVDTAFPEETLKRSTEKLGVDLISSLRDPESLRSAVLLREILGPPRGLQSWK